MPGWDVFVKSEKKRLRRPTFAMVVPFHKAGRQRRAENCVSQSRRALGSRYSESFHLLLVQVNSQPGSVGDLEIAVLGA